MTTEELINWLRDLVIVSGGFSADFAEVGGVSGEFRFKTPEDVHGVIKLELDQ